MRLIRVRNTFRFGDLAVWRLDIWRWRQHICFIVQTRGPRLWLTASVTTSHAIRITAIPKASERYGMKSNSRWLASLNTIRITRISILIWNKTEPGRIRGSLLNTSRHGAEASHDTKSVDSSANISETLHKTAKVLMMILHQLNGSLL
jgi:hypothetical protein